MARYQLLAGQHVMADKSKPVLGPDGKPTGRYQKKVVKAGQVVESDVDLVVAHGQGHFGYVGLAGDADRVRELEAEVAALRQSAAPGGQVSSGHQVTTSAPGGGTVTGFAAAPEKAPAPAPAPAVAPAAVPAPAPPPRDLEASYGGLEFKTVAELRDIAEVEDVDVKGLHSKADILKALRARK